MSGYNMNNKFKKITLTALFLAVFASGWILGVMADGTAVTKEMVIQTQKLIGLEFDESEVDSMLTGLDDNLKKLRGLRQYELSNDVTPVLLFNPVPSDYVISEKQRPLIFQDYRRTKLPDNREDLAFYSVGELSYLIKTRRISCEDLSRFFLERLKKYGPGLECVITLTEDLAIKRAKELDQELKTGKYRGPLHGIPYGLKDLFAVKGYKTTFGSVPYKDQYIDINSTVYNKLNEAGGVLLAKLTLGELAMGDVWFGGKTRNPWNIKEGSSGSSAGSAAAVSAGLLPFAIGTETWGSIVSPSTVCGTSGLRPTYGRISRAGAMALCWSMDKVGPICRSAEDCAIVFNYMRGKDGLDMSVTDAPFNYNSNADLKKLRIGYLKNYFSRNYELKENDSLTLAAIKQMGVDLIPVEFIPAVNVMDLSIILDAESAAAFDLLTRSNKDDLMVRQNKYAWPNNFRISRFVPAVEYINANRLRQKLITQMNRLMKEYDVLIVPSLEDSFLLLTNLTGHPCITIPNGFTKQGTPTSITFVGRLFEEGIILSAAHQFQAKTNFHLQHPKL